MLASLRRHRNYRLYFAGQFVSQIGTWLQTAAQAWLILDLTHSAQTVGVLGFFFYGPYAVLGLVGGAYADRWDRRKTLLVTQVAMAVCALLLAIALYAHFASVWFIDAIAFVRGVVLVFNSPSRQALMVQLVGRAELGLQCDRLYPGHPGDRGDAHAQTFGWIAAVFGLGAMIGALVAAARTRASRRLLLGAGAIFGIAECALAMQTRVIPVALLLLLTGIAYTIYTAGTNAFVQLATPGFLQGRVGGLYNYAFIASGPIGSLLAGWLCERGGTGLAFMLGGVATLAVMVLGLATYPWPMPTGTARR